MMYILDTGIFRELLDHFPKNGAYYTKVWTSLDNLIADGSVASVDECYNELEKHFSSKEKNMEWINKHKAMFLPPTNNESLFIRNMFLNKKMQESIHQINILENRPAADP